MPGEDEAVLAAEARLAFDADLAGLPAAPNENGSASSQRDGSGDQEEDDDIREGETGEEALQRRIEEGNIGKGKTLRRWKNTEEKQRMVETWRQESKVQRYGQIYEEVKALRKETRHSVRDLRERFKEKGVIQNKDQFIVKLIAQERNEQEGKVAAIRSLQQWRLTDVELHNFINRCHKKGIAGKLDLAMQWAEEQEEAGGEVNFKEGLAFYSSIGILQPRSSAHTQQQWREWREWEDALTCALEKFKGRRAAEGVKAPDAAGPEGSLSNEDSTVCNSPWSSERGGGGSFAGFSGSLRASSAHGVGEGRNFRSRSGTAPENGIASDAQALKDSLTLPRRGRTPPHRGDSGDGPSNREQLSWRSYSPPSSLLRQKQRRSGEGGGGGGRKKHPSPGFGHPASGLPNGGGGGAFVSNGKPPPSPVGGGGIGIDSSDGVGGGGSGKLVESVVRSSGGYLPPRHPLAGLQLSPASQKGASGSESGEAGACGGVRAGGGAEAEAEAEAPTLDAVPVRPELRGRGAARTAAKGPAADTPEKPPAEDGPAPTEEEGPAPTEGSSGGGRRRPTNKSRRKLRYSHGDAGGRGGVDGEAGGRPRSFSGVLSGLADWLMPGMEGNRRSAAGAEKTELLMEVYPAAPLSPEARRPTAARSAPATPRGRRRPSSVLRDGGWFYNGDSDYSTEEEVDGSYESDDEGFWADAGPMKPPKKIGGGGGTSILSRLRKLFT